MKLTIKCILFAQLLVIAEAAVSYWTAVDFPREITAPNVPSSSSVDFDCKACIGAPTGSSQSDPSQKYVCLDYWGASYATCCQKITVPTSGSSSLVLPWSPCSDPERNKKLLCSNWVKKESSLKYAFCPYRQEKCFQRPVLAAGGKSSHVVATTTEFKKDDVCSWKIVPTDTELGFSRTLNITVNSVIDVDCKVYYGESMDKLLDNSFDCSPKNKTSYSDNKIPANNHAVIVVYGKTNQAQISIQYELADFLDSTTYLILLGFAACVIVCSVNIFILFVLNKTTKVQFSKVKQTFTEQGVYMCIEMSKSVDAAKEAAKLPKENQETHKSTEGNVNAAVGSPSKSAKNNKVGILNERGREVDDSRLSQVQMADQSQANLLNQNAEVFAESQKQQSQMQQQMLQQMNNMMMQKMMMNMVKEMNGSGGNRNSNRNRRSRDYDDESNDPRARDRGRGRQRDDKSRNQPRVDDIDKDRPQSRIPPSAQGARPQRPATNASLAGRSQAAKSNNQAAIPPKSQNSKR